VAGRIIYLEVDDEITSAAARIRASDAPRIAVVLPYGSRVATSRINFRLLSRDALTHDKRLSIVTGDPATRALAASAGLAVFASVAEYESATAGAEDDGPRPETAAVPVAAASVVADASEPAAVVESDAADEAGEPEEANEPVQCVLHDASLLARTAPKSAVRRRSPQRTARGRTGKHRIRAGPISNADNPARPLPDLFGPYRRQAGVPR